MIDPIQDDLRRLLLEGIRYDRVGGTGKGARSSMFCSDMTIKGVINSFVEVEQYKKKGNLNVSFLSQKLNAKLSSKSYINSILAVRKLF